MFSPSESILSIERIFVACQRHRVALPAQKGVVKIGSTVAEVIRLLGAPDRTEPGSRPGSVFMIYGQLGFELRNGGVVGGGI